MHSYGQKDTLKNMIRRIFIWFFIFFVVFNVEATKYDMVNLTSNKGLSNSSVNVTFQSSNGLMWFGTWDGLDIFNGKDFKVYKPQLNNNHSISNNIIRDIIEENRETYWISTDLGVNRFDLRTNSFESFFANTRDQIVFNEKSFFIAKNSENNIFAAVIKKGLYFYNKQKKQFVSLKLKKDIQYKKIFFDLDDNLWCYTNDKRLFKIVFKKEKTDVPVISNVVDFQSLKNIESTFCFNKNEIWMQNSDKQIYVYNISAGNFSPVILNQIPSIGIIKAAIKKNNEVILGTESGLYQYDIHSKKVESILSNTSILSLYFGTQNILWVGTDMQGVWLLAPPKEKFLTFNSSNIPGFGKSAVRTFALDNYNNLWIGTKGNGIYIFRNGESENSLKISSHLSISNGLQSNSVFKISKGLKNELWIGTDGKGINYSIEQSGKIYTLTIPDSLQSKINLSSVYSILPELNNILWVGTSGFGMYKLEINTNTTPYSIKSYKHFIYKNNSPSSLSNNIVYSIIKENDRFLWIATRGGGLNKFDLEKETFQTFKNEPNNPNSLTSNDILSLLKDKKGILWVGTSMGLNKLAGYKNQKPIFTRFTEKEEITNNTIHGILEDKKNNIWITTNDGIAKLILENGKYRILTFNKNDGLQSNEFSDGATYSSSNLTIFHIGGVDGFNQFRPLDISQNNYMPQLWLDAFYVDNNQENISDFMKNNKLILPYKNKSFSFKFIPLDYIAGSKCEIAYLIEGYQKDWIQLGTSNTIVISNLPKGNYVLKVRCSNADKIWNKKSFILPIEMTTPWWNTNLAYVLYVVFILILLWGIWKIIINQTRAKNNILLKEQEKQKAEEIHQAKLQFFTNIAHEFSNSLTLIYGPCEQLLRNSNTNLTIKKYVNTIKSNSERMQGLIQQLIDFRKAETGHLQINIENIDISELVIYVLDNFLDMLEQKKIKYNITFIPENIIWQTDRDSLEKIIFNLISNAVKYTPQDESINIYIIANDEKLEIKITNTGVGIDAAYQKSIFDRFEVLNRFEKQVSKGLETRNGIGLALCKSLIEMLDGSIELFSDGKTYTSFHIELPKKNIIFNDNDTSPTITELRKEGRFLNENSYSVTNIEEIDTLDVSKKELILIIDDDVEIRKLIKDILIEKFSIVEAGNGSEAITIMRKRLPTVIICDVIMPIMDGVEYVKTMKSQELTKYIPIILLSTKSSIENQISGLEIGADAYLTKPFHPHHLEVLVENILNKNKTLKDYNTSPYSAFEQFEGKIIHKEDKDLIIKITKIIYDNIEKEELTIDYIAGETAISKMQLYRKVKGILEQTPTEYIRSIRLKQSEKLLKTTNKTVAEIMYGCGFNNKAYFYREFNKKYGRTPKEYRSENSINEASNTE